MKFFIYQLQAVAFVDLLAVGMIVPQVANHVRQLGGNHIYVGLLGSIYAGFQLASGPLIGSLSDIKGRKSILMVTLLLCSGAYVLLGTTTSIIVILFVRAFLGLFKQTQMLTRALVPDYEKNENKQSEIYGKLAAISGVGMTLGPVIGGHIAEDNPENGFTIISMLVGVGFAINSGLVYLLPTVKRSIKRKPPSSKPLQTNIYNSIGLSLKQSFVQLQSVPWSEYWDIFALKALVGFAMGVYYSNYSLYLKTEYHLSPKYVGYVISFQGVVGSISSYFIGFINSFYTNDIDYSERNFHVFLILNLSLIGLISSLNIYFYVFWLIPLAIGNAICRLVTLEMILKRNSGEHRGTLLGASNSVRSLAGVVAPMVAGFIGQYFGVTYVIYASLCSTLAGTFMSYQLRSNAQNKRVKKD